MAVVTVILTVPVPAGAITVMLVSLFTLKLVAAVEPNMTLVAPVKPLPVMVTLVPPVTGPFVGLMLLMLGAVVYVNSSFAFTVEVPLAVVTVISTVPVPAGAITVMLVSLFTLKLVAAVEPNLTLVVPVKPVPVMVTLVPPARGPLVGLMLLMLGAVA